MRKSKNHALLLSFPVNRWEDPTVGYLNGLKNMMPVHFLFSTGLNERLLLLSAALLYITFHGMVDRNT